MLIDLRENEWSTAAVIERLQKKHQINYILQREKDKNRMGAVLR